MIGGRILDPGALAALLDGNLVVQSWLAVARTEGLTLYVPALVRAEVAGLRKHQAALLDILDAHPHVLVDPLLRADAAEIEVLLAGAGVWDATAAAVVLAARRRGWQIIAGDPGRLTRVDPHAAIDPL